MNLREPDAVIANWPECDRPAHKLLTSGAMALSDSELIAVLIRTGRNGESAVDTARRLISESGNLLAAIDNVAAVASDQHARLQASMELARRVLREKLDRGNALSSPQSVRDYLRLKLQNRPHEVFVCVFLDAQNRVIADEELFRGTLTQTSVYPREVVKKALQHNAAAVIFAHNHPSGIAEPSRSDEALTQALKQALALVDVKVLDHFVIGAGAAMSFAERGLL